MSKIDNYQAYRTKEDAYLLIALKAKEKKQDSHLFLIDPWKVGLRYHDTFDGNLARAKRQLGLQSTILHQIPGEIALKLLKRGYKIARELDVDIPKSTEEVLEEFNMANVEDEGSLYRCFNCEEGNLTQEEVDEILEIAESDLEKDLIGTEEEEQYFYICASCKQEMHQSHSSPN